jgi:ribosomal protein L11 methyltransferase
MAWVRLDIPCDPDAADVVAALVLAETGRGASLLEHDAATVVQAWIPENWRPELEERLKQRLLAAGPPYSDGADAIAAVTIADDDWTLGWRRHFSPFRVGRRMVIKPSWESWPPAGRADLARPDDLIIEIDPGEAFGTGTHASTQLALRALEGTVGIGSTVADVGCGSGILSLAARLLGASRLVAVDFDPAAAQSTLRNLRAQGLAGDAGVLIGEGLAAIRGRFDVVVANITADGAIAVGSQVADRLRPGGRYIVSGFLERSVPRVERALVRFGLAPINGDALDGWASLILARAGESAR